MTPLPAVLTLRSMAYAATREQAQTIARSALDQGAQPGDVADALTEWAELQARSVQVIPRDGRASIPDHLRTDTVVDYLRAKGEL